MKKQLQLIVSTIFIVLAGLTGYGQQVGDTFDAANGIRYQITSVNNPRTVTVTGRADSSTDTDITIPATVAYGPSDYAVTRIGRDAFIDQALNSVSIGQNVTSIGTSAFWKNDLTSVAIPDGVESIEGLAFAENNLASVTIPNDVIIIGARAFQNNQLTRVTIPGSVTDIKGAAFADNRITIVVLAGTDPPNLGSNDVGTPGFTDAFTNSGTIDVVVPRGALNDYKTAWNSFNFKSITEKRDIGETFTVNGITYEITALGSPGPNTVTITDNTNTGDLTISGAVTYGPNDFNVTRIEESAFQGNALTSVTISGSVTDIGGVAFTNNPDLVTVVLEHTDLPSIEESTFEDRSQIDLVVPKGTLNDYETAWGGFNFKSITEEKGVGETFTVNGTTYEITALGSPGPNTVTITGYQNQNTTTIVDIPETITYQGNGFEVTRIGDSAFQGNALTNVIIPNRVTSIGQRAFQNNQLTSVIIPESVETIEDWAFANNPGLAMVGSERSEPPSIEENTFDRNQIDVIVPRGASNDYETAWTGFRSIAEEGDLDETFTANGITYRITSLNPRTVTVTGRADNSTDTDITIPGTVAYELNYAVTGIGADAFTDNQLTSVGIGQNVTIIRSGAFWKNNLTSVAIPDGVKSIGGLAFAENNLTSVTIPNGVTNIEVRAFQGNALTSVTIPESVTDIEGAAFADNPGLATVVSGPSTPPNLGSYGIGPGFTDAFTDRGTIDVIVPKGASNDYTTAWTGFRSITEDEENSDSFTIEGITYQVNELNPNTVTITGNTNIGDLTIPGTITYGSNDFEVTRIGDYAFQGNALTSVTIPGSVTSIGFGAFSVCGLSSVHISEGVTRIEESAFRINQLTSVTLPNSVTRIGVNAFAFNELTHFTIPSNGNLTSIGDGALCHNNLSSVTIPSGVTSIGQNVFKDNPNLATVVSKRTAPPSIQVGTFINADRTEIDVIVPKGALNNYKDDAQWAGFNSITQGIGVSIDAPALIDNLTLFSATFRFDLDVTGFTMDDIDLINATADNFTGSGSIYTVEITPTSCNGAVQIDIPANVAEYATNFPNLAASTTVTVQDGPLTAIARDMTVELDASGQASITPGQVDNGSHGSCNSDSISLSLDKTTFNCNDIGMPVTVVLTAVQGNNTVTATAGIEVVDGMSPTAIAKDYTVQLDASGNASIQAGDINNGSSDNCGIATVTVSPSSFDSTDLGANTVSLTVTDSSGNRHTATATVTVEAYPAQIGRVVTVSGMDYEITSMSPYTVTVTGISTISISGRSPTAPSAITIPETIIHGGTTYVVTGIGDGAFEYSDLTSVDIGDNVTSIGSNAFKGNRLTSVTIPASVTSIGANAFTGNPDLVTVEVKGAVPPSFHEEAFDTTNRDQIKLKVPVGKIDAYLAAGWTSFESISDGSTLIIGGPEKDSFIFYPNPARDKVHIDLGPGLELKQVNIYTTAGAYLYSENGLEINTGHLSKGMYLFEIVTKTGNRSTEKIVIADR